MAISCKGLAPSPSAKLSTLETKLLFYDTQTRPLFTHIRLFGYLLGVVTAEHRRAQTAGRPPGPGAKLSNPGNQTPDYSILKHARCALMLTLPPLTCPLIRTLFSRATNRLKSTRRLLFPSRARD